MKSFARATLALAAAACAVTATGSAGAAAYRLPAGTPVQLATLSELNTKHMHAGDRFYLDVTAPLVAGGETIVPENSVAVGEVGGMKRNGHFGGAGRMAIRILYIDTPQMRIPLTGEARSRGTAGSWNAAGAYVVAGSLAGMGLLGAFLVHGGSGIIHAGTPVTAMLDDDVSVYAADAPHARAAGAMTASR